MQIPIKKEGEKLKCRNRCYNKMPKFFIKVLNQNVFLFYNGNPAKKTI